MYICDFSRSVGADRATTRNTRGLTRSVIRLIVPPGGVPALEHDADLGSRRLDPLLHGDELAVQDSHLPLVLLALHLGKAGRWGLAGFGLLAGSHSARIVRSGTRVFIRPG